MDISRRSFAAGVVGLAGILPNRLRAVRPLPKLFVFLIAEQFRQIYLDRSFNSLSTGGFRELMTKGVYYPNCRLAASSFTSSGLATLATGAYPQLHGIVADRWFDRKTGTVAKARAEMLEATTLADEAARTGSSRIFCIGMDEGPVTLLAGRSNAQVFWINAEGDFSTRGNIPDYLVQFNRYWLARNKHETRWLAIGAGPDTPPLRTLNFDPKHPEDFMALYLSSPFAQAKQFDLLRTLFTQEKLGQGETVDFVFVSLGAMARLGHETGSDSPLMQQMSLELDRQIQSTFEALNKSPGKNSYNMIFAAAHGALPDPEAQTHSQKPITSETIARSIDTICSDRFDKGGTKNRYVEKYIYPFLYLRLDFLRDRNIPFRDARRVAAEAALRTPGVAGYYTADGDCSHSGEWRRRFENSFNDLRSGDIMLSYEPGAIEDFNGGRGVSYGSLYNYDTRVPLFLYGPQFGRKQIERTIETVDVAPTLARVASLSLPSSATGDVLEEALADAEDVK